jgi:hypothetical protein
MARKNKYTCKTVSKTFRIPECCMDDVAFAIKKITKKYIVKK